MSALSRIVLARSTALASPAVHRRFTMDALTFDQATMDSAGAFLVGELERLDQTLHMPLTTVSWPRDIDLREDVTIADEVSSFTNSSFAAPGGLTPTGKNWISKDATAIPGVALDIGKTPRPLHLWGMEVKWSLPELYSAQQLGRPVDSQKLEGLKLKHNMDIDEMVYVGDTSKGAKGLVNLTGVTPTNVPSDGTGASPLWTTKTADQILRDVNALLRAAWNASALAVAPTELRIDPANFAYLAGARVSANSDTTILEFVREKNISSVINGKALNVQPLKWLTGAGAGSTNRAVAYTRKQEFVRFPLVPIQRTPLEARGIFQITTYFCRLGEVEAPYVETVAYADGM